MPRRGRAAVLALPVLFNLWFLRSETRVAEYVNDGSVHAALIRWATQRWSAGRIPLDGWFPYLTTGAPLIHNIEALPHIVAGLFGAAIGGNTAYSLSNYLLIAVWPLSVYAGARLLGWRPHAALAAAAIAPFVASVTGYGYEFGSYTFAGLGLWTQAWAMVLLPPTLGLTWRAVNEGGKLFLPALALAATLSCHVVTGYFAILALGVWLIVGGSGAGWRRAAGRTLALAGVALATNAWMLIPRLQDGRWAVDDGFTTGTFWRNSFGLPRELGWLFAGKLFDAGSSGTRVPVLTMLVVIGMVVCLVRFRQDVRCRALLGLWVVSLVLFAGPATFGFVLNHLPGSHELLFHRYVLAVHVSGILLAGVGGGWLWNVLRSALRRTKLRPVPTAAVLGAIAVVVLAPAWVERLHYATRDGSLIGNQRVLLAANRQPETDAIAVVNELHDGRVYAGLPTNWGRSNVVGYVPGYISLLNHDTDAIGFTLRPVRNMLAGVEPYLNDAALGQLDAFGIRYLLLPADRLPPANAVKVFSEGTETLWSVPTSGYVALVDTVEPIALSRRSAAPVVQWLSSSDPQRRLYPTLAFAGAQATTPTSSRLAPPRTAPGTVTPSDYQPAKGVFLAHVVARREAAAVLKSAYNSRWRVLVDGRPVDSYIVAPGYPAATVSAGAHTVEFRYVPSSSAFWYLLLALAVLLAVYASGRRLTHRVERAPVVEPY